MENFRIYLAGGMQDISFEESQAWRVQISALLTDVESSYKVICTNPNDFYNFQEVKYDSEKEVRDFDLYKVRHSNLIIINFNSPKSIGTAQELAIANEHRIPVIGLNTENYQLHPWLVESCDKIFADMNELIDYVRDFYLMEG